MNLFFSLLPLLAAFSVETAGHILYLIHKGDTERAFKNYMEEVQTTKTHDFSLLRDIGMRILEKGIASSDPEIRLMSLYGAGVSMSADLVPILEKGISADDMRMQVVALNYLARLNDDEADSLLLDALSSPFLLSRLEACFSLAKKNHPMVLGHLQSLMVKVPKEVRPLFPQIAILLEGAPASSYMRQLLSDQDLLVRTEAILTVAKAGRDDFLPQIRGLATQVHFSQQESCAYALGKLKDMHSLSLLEKLSASSREEVRLAAALALIKLGKKEALSIILEEAENENPFAIYALGKLKEGKEILKRLSKSEVRDVRINAAYSLLRMKEIVSIDELLIQDIYDFGFFKALSGGGSLKAWKVLDGASGREKNYPGLKNKTRAFREEVLLLSAELPKEHFLNIAHRIIDKNQTDLIPLLVELLKNRFNEDVHALLQKGAQKAGAPLIRNYCILALYQIKGDKVYEDLLLDWVKKSDSHPLIQFVDEKEELPERFLSPDEVSRFLVDVFETLASSQNSAGIDALLHAMAYGNPKNRYALAGLLLRTIE